MSPPSLKCCISCSRMPPKLIFFSILCILCVCANAGVPLKRFEALMKQQSFEQGLYNASDKVTVLTNVNFKEIVLQQNRSSLVEFYNSYCGHCKRFAPSYKQLADQLQSWKNLLPICAIDCAVDENNGICREYEIMAYPTLRYFGPGYMPSEQNYGSQIDTQDLNEIRTTLAQFLAAENRTDNMTNWPNLQSLSSVEIPTLTDQLKGEKEYVVVIYEPENTTIGIETILHYHNWPNIILRRVNDLDVATRLHIDGANHKIATIDRRGSIVTYNTAADSSEANIETVKTFLRTQHITERPRSDNENLYGNQNSTNSPGISLKTEIIAEVKRNKHLVYQADLEMAVKGVIFNEIPKTANISGERLLAVQRFLSLLRRYNPLGMQGQIFITKLHEFVSLFNQELSGKQFEEEAHRLEQKLAPIFSANDYVGCIGSRQNLRGYTCSLWQLFHFMTVQAAETELSKDPLEVLQGMHAYIKNFFGCTDCAEHFQDMAARRKIWSTTSKDEAVLWLWAAHNEVNQRLAGDSTEDPNFPKIQFPSQSSCSQCYKQPPTLPDSKSPNWDKDAVLSFLKNIYNPEFISRFGVERDELLRPTLEKLRQKRMISNVFSDMDMRMGMLLYGFCIVIMVVALKLFAFKGYRKKPYGHDMLGKV